MVREDTNLGKRIEANTELIDDTKGTLFKVIPKNSSEALQNIKDALDIFINAPSVPVTAIQILPSTDIGETRWNANILHLQSQLMMVQSVIQMKDATIESLNLSNYQLKQIVTEKENEASASEDIVPGIVTLNKYDFGAGSINLAEIWRRLKKVFSKNLNQ